MNNDTLFIHLILPISGCDYGDSSAKLRNSAGIGLLIMKFVGFDLIPQLSEEANFPKKHLWKAFLGALGCTVLVYGLAVVAIGGIVSLDWIDSVNIVDPKVADFLGLHWLGILIVVMGVLT
ncbi:MAG: hypothetical protein ACI4LL_02675, partial [Anaerovoracaceae bacterium]